MKPEHSRPAPYDEGWFADLTDADLRLESAPWQAFIQVEGACHALDGVWFQTEADCLAFIRRCLVGQKELR